MTQDEHIAASIAQARENARANRPKPAIGGDRATQSVREEFQVRKWASDESKQAGEPPYETNVTTIESVVDRETGEVISRREVEPDGITATPQVPLDI